MAKRTLSITLDPLDSKLSNPKLHLIDSVLLRRESSQRIQESTESLKDTPIKRKSMLPPKSTRYEPHISPKRKQTFRISRIQELKFPPQSISVQVKSFKPLKMA